jgi:hypothetical protein
MSYVKDMRKTPVPKTLLLYWKELEDDKEQDLKMQKKKKQTLICQSIKEGKQSKIPPRDELKQKHTRNDKLHDATTH